MLAILLCSHSDFSLGIKKSAEMIIGPLEKVESLSLQVGESLEHFSQKIRKVYDSFIKDGDDVICLTDLEHATPYNACLLALADQDVTIISGMSLPLLLELVLGRNSEYEISSFTKHCLASAKESMKIIKTTELFSQ